MRVLILGHSGTTSAGIAAGVETWPEILERDMAPAWGVETSVDLVPLAPINAEAVAYAVNKIDEADPDLVLFSISCFHCSVGVVGARVRQRFGSRVHRVYRRLELRLEGQRAEHEPGRPSRLRNSARRLARRTLGTATLTSVAGAAGVYEAVLAHLATRENTTTLVMAETPMARSILAENPDAESRAAELHQRVREAAEARRMPWMDLAPAFHGRRQRRMHPTAFTLRPLVITSWLRRSNNALRRSWPAHKPRAATHSHPNGD